MAITKKRSRLWYERQTQILAQGRTSPVSKDASQFINGIYPTHTNGSGYKCYLEDSDGNKYVDMISGLGAISLGYGDPKVTEAAIRQLRKGVSFSLPTTLEVEVAELLQSLIPCTDKWRFFKNGKDCADAAERIARAYTKRDRIYSRGYHGCSSLWTSLTEPRIGVVDSFKASSFEKTSDIEWGDTAGVIVEAYHLEDSAEYIAELRELREACRKNGAVFIIDEIVTGFRVPRLTVSNLYQLDPDIILLGKGMANGFPLSAIGGKRDIIDCGEWFFSTTFSGEAVSLAACQATIEKIQTKSLHDLMFYGKRLQTKLNELHPEIQWKGYGTRALLNTDNPTTQLLMQECADAGYLLGKAWFFNFSHLEEDIEPRLLTACRAIIENINQGRVKLRGTPPVQIFKR
jgi:glutamate-1-semialdehyde aminotransferase